MIRVFFSTFIAALCLVNCGGTPVLPGDLGKTTDGVLVPCEPIRGQLRSCLVLANPNNENIKVLDATIRQFMLAPRGYATLSVPVGAGTSRLASAPELDFVLALDTVQNKVYRVRTRGYSNETPTFAVAVTYDAPRQGSAGAVDFALAKVGGQSEYSLIYALPNSLRIVPIDNATALQNLSSEYAIDFSPRIISSVAVSSAGAEQGDGYLAIAFEDDGTFGTDPKGTVEVIKLSSITTKANNFTRISIGGFASQMRLSNLTFDGQPAAIPFLFAVRSDGDSLKEEVLAPYELVATRIDKDPNPDPVRKQFEHLLTALYLPSQGTKQGPQPCCGGSKRWAAVTTVRGSFHYVTVGDLVSVNGNPTELTDAQVVNLSDDTSLGSQATFPTAIFGGRIELPPGVTPDENANCQNRIFITFQSGLLASACEGQKGISKVGL